MTGCVPTEGGAEAERRLFFLTAFLSFSHILKLCLRWSERLVPDGMMSSDTRAD